ncbi:hypothetical protein [Clostridium folliculivorans]|uniref:Uncharacterized protein n=1 Tax=Clostridium folliculivorans TaxID=2886038 RepID=A0A9W6D9C5_9CLOT|nr:hypothetical protein [Clostridium folliculivorans]GKU23984.1 hypothetical protein CFOLD11_08100 [Clostridium folliculivorans]GKU30099.1 hypothetical protein CFB3_22060 [Clostridium folliculivorans]
MRKVISRMLVIVAFLCLISIQIFYNLGRKQYNNDLSNKLDYRSIPNVHLNKNNKVKESLYDVISKLKEREEISINNITKKDGYKEISFSVNTDMTKLTNLVDFFQDNDIIIIKYSIQQKDNVLKCNILGQYRGKVNE